jgi:glycerol-3-phosphate dehydrogenase (NAD(P)+)
VAKAIYRKAELGQVDLKDFPMLVHVEGILEKGADAQHPWEAYTFDTTC